MLWALPAGAIFQALDHLYIFRYTLLGKKQPPIPRAAVDNGSDTWKQQQITARDIQTVLVLGVTFKGNVTIGKDLPLSQIHADHDALLIATGAKIQIV
jgi:hypothetical protein